ncbi:MAG: cytochrome c biogenesis protein CcsA [Verrucomicrobiota bacterium]|nr:cytochrome c biogenesis protein CcsA [Verrucomicrobiota bacterium]
MKKFVPVIVVVVMALWALMGLVRIPKVASEKPDIYGFGKLPVLLDGRIQPIDSTARNAMQVIRHKSTGRYARNGGEVETIPAIEWLLELAAKPVVARTRPVFRIDNEETKDNLRLAKDEKHFSVNDITAGNNFERLARESGRIRSKESSLRTPYEKSLKAVADSLLIYQRLAKSFRPQNSVDFDSELTQFETIFPIGMAAVRAHETDAEHNEDEHHQFSGLIETLIDPSIRDGDRSGVMFWPRVIPPGKGSKASWQSLGANLFHSITNSAAASSDWKIEFDTATKSYAGMVSAYAKGDAAGFNSALAGYHDDLKKNGQSTALSKTGKEFAFNNFDPFYKCEILYVLAFLLACGGWLTLAKWPNQTAYYLIALAAVIHTSGLIFRMWLEGRPPVTNLYSAAVFVGWGAVILGLILERIYRDGIGNVVASSVGFVTLLVAGGLSLSGDTMEMLQAVLDTNFWLATHVVIITIGYAATFVAGFLAIVYVVRDFVANKVPFDKTNRSSLTKMIYGIVCFATLFSFVGTVLGGIWADQSWGRFWGWDPKENGALMIVIWNAAILHARWGGIIRERGLVAMAIFGNAVTAWSFFGTNMLGIGLHSYGFMDKAFAWLMVFVCIQIVVMTGGLMLGTLGQAGKPSVQKTGQTALSLPPLAQLAIEALVIVASFAVTIFYLLKALGIWL